jgi:D-alanine-D-alanine ligase
MVVGLTYDLRSDYLKLGYSEQETAEFDREDTIDAIENAILRLGFKTERIGNVMALIRQLNDGRRWDIVFNICEGLYGIGREAQVPALLEAYRIPYVFSGPVVLALTLHKALTKRVVRDAGILTPDFVVIDEITQTDDVYLDYPLFAKPLAEGTGKGIDSKSVVNNRAELKKLCSELLEKYKQPVLVESFLPGREFTVGITGTGNNARVVGVMEVSLNNEAEKDVYSFKNKEECETLVKYIPLKGKLADEAISLSLKAYRVLECLDAGRVDVRLDAQGRPQFIEINPLAGLHPEHSDLPILCSLHGISYLQLMEQIMRSALERNQMNYPEKQ